MARRMVDKTCSPDCSIQHRRKLSRESSARHYKPRPPRPDTTCDGCGIVLAAPKSGPVPRWCGTCRKNREDVRARLRAGVRRCYKCNAECPDAERKPGKTVCDDCRVDPRKRDKMYDQRRRLRKYGITQDEYDQMLADQGGKCLGCGTSEPGGRGWNIDHCHQSGTVRAILCHRCNTAIGLTGENSQVLRALAQMVEAF